MSGLFDLAQYEKLAGAFLERGYEVVDFEEGRRRWRQGKKLFALWRHDVDFCLKRASRLARLEQRLGIRSDYFVLLRSPMYNLLEPGRIVELRELQGMGHRVGLHCDASLYDGSQEGHRPQEVTDLKMRAVHDGIEAECRALESWLGKRVAVVTFHRPAESLLKAGISLAGRSHGYEDVFFKDMAYFSDSRGEWRYGSPLESAAFAGGLPMQVLTHPIWWVGKTGQTPTERLNEFLAELKEEVRTQIAANCDAYEWRAPGPSSEGETLGPGVDGEKRAGGQNPCGRGIEHGG